MFAVETIEPSLLERFPAFVKRMDLVPRESSMEAKSGNMGRAPRRRARAADDCSRFIGRKRLVRILTRVLDENEFLSPYGVRALSRVYKDHPYVVNLGGVGANRRVRAGRVDVGSVRR